VFDLAVTGCSGHSQIGFQQSAFSSQLSAVSKLDDACVFADS
jgi:hypothetical protein